MDKPCETMDELDALIEAALTEEPFLRAPLSLHRGVEARVRLVTMCEQEHRRFAVSMLTLACLFVGSLVIAGVLLWFTNLSFLYSEGVSGGKGWYDYYANSLSLSFNSYQGSYTLLASFVIAIATVVLASLLQIHKFIYSD